MTLPNFFVPGAQKAGTTTLYHHLNSHPEIFMCPYKEPQFFDRPGVINRSDKVYYSMGIEAYEKLYDGVKDEKMIGEATPFYMISEVAIERIKKHIENPKFVFTIRNPIDRAYSNYNMMLKGKRAFQNFQDHFDDVLNSSKSGLYVRGLYGKWIQKYIEAFGEENVHVMIFERWSKNPLKEINECYKFLGVQPLDNIENKNHNEGLYYRYLYIYQVLHKIWVNLRRTFIGQFFIKTGIKTFARNYLLHRSVPLEPLNTEERAWLANLYKEDVGFLRKLLNDPIKEWEKDFPL